MTFRKLDLFPSSGEGGGEDNQLGPLERANLNHSSPEEENRSSFRNVVFSRIPDDGKVPNPSNSVSLTTVWNAGYLDVFSNYVTNLIHCTTCVSLFGTFLSKLASLISHCEAEA
jgi:hypothetical protein